MAVRVIRRAHASWSGTVEDGGGRIGVGSGAFEGPFTLKARAEEGQRGTNPEELIGAAHAACFSMALSNILATAGHTPESVSTTAKVHLRQLDGRPTIATIELVTVGVVPGLTPAEFAGHAEAAKAGCPISRALAAVPEITLDATLAG